MYGALLKTSPTPQPEVLKLYSTAVMWSGVETQQIFVLKKQFFEETQGTVSRRIDSGLARNVSHVFWHQPVCFEKFLIAAVCRVRRFAENFTNTTARGVKTVLYSSHVVGG